MPSLLLCLIIYLVAHLWENSKLRQFACIEPRDHIRLNKIHLSFLNFPLHQSFFVYKIINQASLINIANEYWCIRWSSTEMYLLCLLMSRLSSIQCNLRVFFPPALLRGMKYWTALLLAMCSTFILKTVCWYKMPYLLVTLASYIFLCNLFIFMLETKVYTIFLR